VRRVVVKATVGSPVPLISIPVLVNNSGPFNFIFDTGAGRTVVAKRLADELRVRMLGTDTITGPAGEMTVEVGRTETISVGDLTANELDVTVADLSHLAALGVEVDGVLGVNYFGAHTVRLDTQAGTLEIGTDFTVDADRGDSIMFSLAPLKPLILVPALVNGSGPYSFGLDTGAVASILSPTTADMASVSNREAAEGIGANGSFGVEAALATVCIGSATRELPVGIVPLEALCAAIGTPLDGLVGLDLIAVSAITIDYPNRVLHLADRS
jgi:hypothetical protein